MFSFFKKKKEPIYDISDIKIKDIDRGFVFDYNFKSWIVKAVGEYDWGNNNFSREYKIDSGDEIAYLELEDSDILFTKPFNIHKLEEDFTEEIMNKDKAPSKIHYNNQIYYLESESAGYYRDCSKSTEDWEELISWDYYTEDKKVINISQWDERTFECFTGITLKNHQISNILPSN